MTIGVTGATGALGRLVVEKLKQKSNAENIVALVRSPEKAAGLGITIRAFDYTQPAILAPNLEGIDQLLLISANEVGKRSQQHKNVIDAAKKAGVKEIVYTSLLHADTTSLSLAKEHIETEQMLKESGIPHTILRNGWYTENYTGSLQGAIDAGSIVGSAGEGKIASATRDDFAEAAAKVLTEKGHVGKVYELAGDESYTLLDLAAEVSKQTGKSIPYQNLSEMEHANVLKERGVPEGFAMAIVEFDTGAANNDLYDDGKVLSKLIGRPTTPLKDAVRKSLS